MLPYRLSLTYLLSFVIGSDVALQDVPYVTPYLPCVIRYRQSIRDAGWEGGREEGRGEEDDLLTVYNK